MKFWKCSIRGQIYDERAKPGGIAATLTVGLFVE